MFCSNYVLKSTLQHGVSVHAEGDLFVLIQHTLMVRTTSENRAVFASLKKCRHWCIEPKIATCRAWARTKGEVKGGNALFGE